MLHNIPEKPGPQTRLQNSRFSHTSLLGQEAMQTGGIQVPTYWSSLLHAQGNLVLDYIEDAGKDAPLKQWYLCTNLHNVIPQNLHIFNTLFFSLHNTRVRILILATPRQIGDKNCWSDVPMQQEGWVLPLPTYVMGAVHHEMGIHSSQLTVSRCRDSV